MGNKKKTRKNIRRKKTDAGHLGQRAPSKSYERAVKLYRTGKMQEALAVLRKISKDSRDYRNGIVSHLKGVIFYNLGQFVDAIHAVKHAVRLDPKNVEFINTLALALDGSGQPMEALRYLSQASTMDKGHVNTYRNMAEILRKLERHDQSLICCKKALEIDPNNLEILKLTAYAYYLLGDLTTAAEYYEQALQQEGDHSEVWTGMGALFQSKGDREGASQCYKKAIQENPHNYPAYENYVHSGILSDDERHELAESLEVFLSSRPLTMGDQRHICFTLGRLYHDLAEYGTAMPFYVQANAFREKELTYNFSLDRFAEEIKHLVSAFDASFFQKKYPGSSSSGQPVFVVGMPRSGTTLLEQIIASHSKGFGAGELPTIKKIVHTEIMSLREKETFEHGLQVLTEEYLEQQADYYLSQSKRHAPSTAEKIVDKFPHNLQFLWCIALLFPQAPIIYCRRDPRDTCLSCFVTDFYSGHGYKKDLFTLGRYYRLYEGLMEHWKRVIPNPIMTVQYEALIDNPEKVSKKVIEHIGLDWEPDCLTLRSKQHFSLTASNIQIREGIYRSAVQRWKKYEKHLQPLLKGLEMLHD